MNAVTWKARDANARDEMLSQQSPQRPLWTVPKKPREQQWRLSNQRPRPVSPSLESTLAGLLERWRSETALSSSLTEMILHPAYQAIIGLGPPVVPLLLRELAREPDHLGWALASITRENPVPASDAGDIDAHTRAWLKWGIEHGHQW